MCIALLTNKGDITFYLKYCLYTCLTPLKLSAMKILSIRALLLERLCIILPNILCIILSLTNGKYLCNHIHVHI